MKIHLKGKASTRQLWINGKELKPYKSQKLRNHSPDGFNWGYGGSGPAQAALAICLELFGQRKALEIYQAFKWEYIADLPFGKDFEKELNIK
jgi:hypothetical protein